MSGLATCGNLRRQFAVHGDVRFERRNKYIYCLAASAAVVASRQGSGGTWNGAVESLKHGWVPRCIDTSAAASTAPGTETMPWLTRARGLPEDRRCLFSREPAPGCQSRRRALTTADIRPSQTPNSQRARWISITMACSCSTWSGGPRRRRSVGRNFANARTCGKISSNLGSTEPSEKAPLRKLAMAATGSRAIRPTVPRVNRRCPASIPNSDRQPLAAAGDRVAGAGCAEGSGGWNLQPSHKALKVPS